MKKQLQEFFYSEQDRGRLVFENDPEYAALLYQTTSLFPDGDLPKEIFDLLESANLLSFAHGFKLGLRLTEWAAH